MISIKIKYNANGGFLPSSLKEQVYYCIDDNTATFSLSQEEAVEGNSLSTTRIIFLEMDEISPYKKHYKFNGWTVKQVSFNNNINVEDISVENNNELVFPETVNISANDVIVLEAVWEEIECSPYFSEDINFINYSDALFLIRNELMQILQDNYDIYGHLKIYISNEQEFIKLKQQMPNAIYIVLRYGAASVNFGQSVLPITITAIAEQNKIDLVQKLFADFASTYNLTRSDDNTMQQIYQTPAVTSNFNQVYEGFRSVMYVSGYLVVSKTANFFTFYYEKDGNLKTNTQIINGEDLSVSVDIDKEFFYYVYPTPQNIEIEVSKNINEFVTYKDNSGNVTLSGGNIRECLDEIKNRFGIDIFYNAMGFDQYSFKVLINTAYKEIEYITSVFGGSTQLDSQTFYNYNNFTKSVAKAGTITFSLTTYLLAENAITNDVLDIYLKRTNINNSFRLTIAPVFGGSLTDIFKLVDCTINQELGQLPMITMTFTN